MRTAFWIPSGLRALYGLVVWKQLRLKIHVCFEIFRDEIAFLLSEIIVFCYMCGNGGILILNGRLVEMSINRRLIVSVCLISVILKDVSLSSTSCVVFE